MSTATVTIHQRPGEMDRLSEAVLASWNRPVSRPLYRGVVWTLFAGAITLGLWPLFKARRWLRDYAAVRQQRGLHLAAWLRATEPDPAADRLEALAHKIRPNRWIHSAGTICLTFAIYSLFRMLHDHQTVWAAPFTRPYTQPQQLYAWMIIAASLIQFVQLLDHHRQFKNFLGELNPLLARHDLPTVSDTSLLSFNFLDWLGGIALGSGGAIWPLPMMLAVGLQRSYIRRGVRVHVQIGDRVRDLLSRQSPPLRLPPRNDLLSRCANLQCGATLPREARFCPRCGNTQNEATAAHNANMSNEATAVR